MSAPQPYRDEDALHAAVAGYLGWCLKEPAYFTTFPAGGGGLSRGLRLKRLGLKAGVPDILLFRPVRVAGANFAFCAGLELKTEDGDLSPAQRETHVLMATAGFRIAVCRSLDDVKAALAYWQFPTRERKPSSERLMAAFDKAEIAAR